MYNEWDRWLKNRDSFADVCKGRYGREVLKTSAAVIDETNILDEITKIEYFHRINAREIDYLERYYRGDQPGQYKHKEVRPEINNRVVENHAFEIVEFFTSQHYGEPIQYAIRNAVGDEKTDNHDIDLLNKIMAKLNKARKDLELGAWQVICGTSYRLISYTQNDIPFQIYTLDPRYTGILYNQLGEPLMSFQQWFNEDGSKVWYCHTHKMFYVIQDEKITHMEINGLRRIPIIECPLNSRRLSYIEIVISLLDCINKIQSNRMDDVEQFVNAFMKFINCEIDEEKFKKMRIAGAIAITSKNGTKADVDMITSELNQQQVQIYKDDIMSMIRTILGMPSREANTGGDTGQAVYLRNGWDFAERMAKLWEPYAVQCENETLEIVSYILSTARHNKYHMNLDIMNTEINITRNKNDNLLVKTQGLQNMLGSGIHPQDAIETTGLFGDPEKVFVNMVKWREENKDETVQMSKVQPSATNGNIRDGTNE